jgi:hypothetical protein
VKYTQVSVDASSILILAMILYTSARSISLLSNFSLGTKDKISFRISPLALQVCGNANPKSFLTFHQKYKSQELVGHVVENLS